ncbi:MAG: TetR/AcrR family transcriptional regulator [Eubacterium sp.]|nr:TetR/AcrR family transcriptional regulator [Eubacterium sp.]
MTEEFVSAKDRIISASIDIISDAGLDSLTIKNISMRTNITESMIYKYCSNTDEILVDVVTTYFKFDSGIFKTIATKDTSYMDKIFIYVDAYSSYYNSYYSLSAIMLQYEELLHNTHTREIVEKGYTFRRECLTKLFQGALDNGELTCEYTAEQLADLLLGIFIVCSLNRRVIQRRKSYKEEINIFYDKWIKTLGYNKKGEVNV